ncbi:relaxase/mobilization nuclease domain-containing protein [Rivihabitans pingtungensis]|uniref:relaxase/mobilization nuclease domain-containing protein n=1 Tax=Rivihabitans pingtungensis TaxID=1054498 RepID=UPI000D76A8DE|nr:relaxase/mobilization nuclease domain-containing protein [Rivihabitans pingtungensis]
MINVINDNGTGSIADAINYLKSDFDHKNVKRSVKPRDFAGSAEECLVVADSIERKHKYVSGTLSFRDGEKPTDAQLQKIVDAFRKTFMAGLEPGVNYVDYWNIHEDKGNIELNYVIPLAELTTSRQMNPFPPGKAKEDFKDAFDAYINHQLGYDQVVPDPIKASESKFERKILPKSNSKSADEFRKNKPTKDEVSDYVAHQIINGKISSRQELCDCLENFGEITRVNNKFISLKPHGSEKAFRLKGPVYEYGADFKKIKIDHQTKNADFKKQLNDSDFEKVRATLERLTKSRREFNKKLISKPFGRKNKDRVYGDKREKPADDGGGTGSIGGSGSTSMTPVLVEKEVPVTKTVQATSDTQQIEIKPITASISTSSGSKSGSAGSNNAPTSSDIISSGGSSSDSSIGGMQSQLNDLRTQISNCKNPAKAQALKSQADSLEQKIGVAVAAERIKKLKESFKSSTHNKLKK